MGLMTVLLKREISTRQMLSKETDNIFLNESNGHEGNINPSPRESGGFNKKRSELISKESRVNQRKGRRSKNSQPKGTGPALASEMTL